MIYNDCSCNGCGYSDCGCDGKTCCDKVLDNLNSVITTDENGENFVKVIGDIEVGEIQVDNTDVVDAITSQTSEINNANLSNVNKVVNEIKTLKTVKNKVKKTTYNVSSVHTLTDNTKQVIVKVISGSGSVGFIDGIKYDFNQDSEKIGLIYESQNSVIDSNIEIILDAGAEIELQEIYEVV